MSATTAAPIPIPALVPIPTKALAVNIPPQVDATAAAHWLTIPRTETKMNIGRLPYTFDNGDQIRGKTPAKTIGTVV